MDFDTIHDRTEAYASKWSNMPEKFGVPQETGLPMWVADSDYSTAPCVIEAIRAEADHGVLGYAPTHLAYRQSVAWWMKNRHDWEIDADWVLTVQGLGNGIATCIQIWSEPGDHIAYFTPVYHEFANKIRANNRQKTELPLARIDNRYELDLDAAQDCLTGNEKILLWCSPQNPSGRVWTADELRAVSEFAARNNMLLVSDEVHHDLVYPGNTFVPMDVEMPDARARTVYLTAASKTFNIAGLRTGQMIIPDPELREKVVKFQKAIDYQPSTMGMVTTQAAYSEEGAKWVDAQVAYLDKNRQILDAGLNAIPGVSSMPMQATFLAWVDFAGTGMGYEEIERRIRDDAQIVVSPGPGFGMGGETSVRINFATQRARVEDAVRRLQSAFGDLQ